MSGIDILAVAEMLDKCRPEEEEEQQEQFEQKIEPKESETFWDESEITPVGFFKDSTDTRPEPRYEITYRQHVGTEDVYLGLSMKDNSIDSCEAIIIKVYLDVSSADDIDLNVQSRYLDLRTVDHRLSLKLELDIDDSKVSAKWNEDEGVLTIELPVIQKGVKFI